jgi:hypothetical protein
MEDEAPVVLLLVVLDWYWLKTLLATVAMAGS